MPRAGTVATDGVHSRSDEVDASAMRRARGDRARRGLRRRRRARTPTSRRARTGSRSRARRSRRSQSHRADRVMLVRVRNADRRRRPNVAVTVETDPAKAAPGTVAFGQRVDDDRLADPERPVWVVDEGPQRRRLGRHQHVGARPRSAPGETKTFTWKVTAVEPGDYTLALPRLARPQRQGAARRRRPHRRRLRGHDRRQAGPRARGRRAATSSAARHRARRRARAGAAAPCRPGRSARSRASAASRPCA